MNNGSLILRCNSNDEFNSGSSSRAITPISSMTPSATLTVFQEENMLDLIDNRQWNRVKSLIRTRPGLAREVLNRSSSSARRTITANTTATLADNNGQLALHEACKCQPPVDVIEALLKANKNAVKEKGQCGYTPLHLAVSHGASVAVVERLIQEYPPSTRMRDDLHQVLPLHLAAKWGASHEVVIEILAAHPEGIYIRDSEDKVPMDYAKKLSMPSERTGVVDALTQGPLLCRVAKAAKTRVATESDNRLRTLQESHENQMTQWEERYVQEKLRSKTAEQAQQRDMDAISALADSATTQLDEKVSELVQFTEKFAEMEAILKDERAQYNEKLDTQASEMQGIIDQETAKCKDMMKRVQEKAAETAILAQSVETLEAAKESLEAQLTSEKEVIRVLVDEVEKIPGLESLVALKDDHISDIEANLEKDGRALETLTSVYTELEKVNTKCQDTLREVMVERDSLRSYNSDLLDKLRDTRRLVKIYKLRNRDVHDVIKKMASSMDTWSVEEVWTQQHGQNKRGRRLNSVSFTEDTLSPSMRNDRNDDPFISPPRQERADSGGVEVSLDDLNGNAGDEDSVDENSKDEAKEPVIDPWTAQPLVSLDESDTTQNDEDDETIATDSAKKEAEEPVADPWTAQSLLSLDESDTTQSVDDEVIATESAKKDESNVSAKKGGGEAENEGQENTPVDHKSQSKDITDQDSGEAENESQESPQVDSKSQPNSTEKGSGEAEKESQGNAQIDSKSQSSSSEKDSGEAESISQENTQADSKNPSKDEVADQESEEIARMDSADREILEIMTKANGEVLGDKHSADAGESSKGKVGNNTPDSTGETTDEKKTDLVVDGEEKEQKTASGEGEQETGEHCSTTKDEALTDHAVTTEVAVDDNRPANPEPYHDDEVMKYRTGLLESVSSEDWGADDVVQCGDIITETTSDGSEIKRESFGAVERATILIEGTLKESRRGDVVKPIRKSSGLKNPAKASSRRKVVSLLDKHGVANEGEDCWEEGVEEEKEEKVQEDGTMRNNILPKLKSVLKKSARSFGSPPRKEKEVGDVQFEQTLFIKEEIPCEAKNDEAVADVDKTSGADDRYTTVDEHTIWNFD